MPRKPHDPAPVVRPLAALHANLARRLGLSVTVYLYAASSGPVWMIRDAASGREVGSFVEFTRSCRALGVCKRVRSACAALELVAAEVAKRNPKLVRRAA